MVVLLLAVSFHCFSDVEMACIDNQLDIIDIRPPILQTNEKMYVAIYDYEARTDEDLTFRVGDILFIIDDRFALIVNFSR